MTSTVGLARALTTAGVETTLVATDMARLPTMPTAERLASADMPLGAELLDIRLLPSAPPRRMANARGLWGELRELVRAADVVHIHSLWLAPQLAAGIVARRERTPYVVSIRGALDPFLRRHGRARKWLVTQLAQRRLLDGASLIHVTSETERLVVTDVAPGVPRAVIPNMLDLSEFDEMPDGRAFRERYLDDPKAPLVLYLGRVNYKKGIDILLEAFARLRGRVPGARLAIVGPDDEDLRPRLVTLAGQLGLGQSVVFVDGLYGREKLEALAAADVWALASHTENFGIAVVEAAAAGAPLVVSTGVNIADEVAATGAGLIAPPTPDGFCEAMDTVLQDRERAAQMRRNGRRFAERYSPAALLPRYLEMYRDVSGADAAGAAARVPSRRRQPTVSLSPRRGDG